MDPFQPQFQLNNPETFEQNGYLFKCLVHLQLPVQLILPFCLFFTQPSFRNQFVNSYFYPKPFTMLGQFSPVEPCSALPTTSWKPMHQLQSLHFRPRTEPIDWRRLAALDVDRVAREMDVGVLQDFIKAVTFCALEGERCPNCNGPADPSLIKLVRMSQLSTEYLLHCQDYLSAQLSGLEERLQGALSWAQQEEKQRVELEKKMCEIKLELRRRKKMVATQQLLLQASANNYHKVVFKKDQLSISYNVIVKP